MNETEFQQIAEDLYLTIEDAVDDSGANIDFENAAGVLTLDCEDTDTKVIVSRQIATLQIWVAAKSGGYHCNYEGQGKDFVCTVTGEGLAALLSRLCSEQSSSVVDLQF